MNQNVISKGSLLHCELLSMLSMNFTVGNCFVTKPHVSISMSTRLACERMRVILITTSHALQLCFLAASLLIFMVIAFNEIVIAQQSVHSSGILNTN